MKTKNAKNDLNIKLLAIAGIGIVIVTGMVMLNEKIFPLANAQNAITQSGNTSPQVTAIQWPPAGWWTNGQPHVPLHTTVVIGINNTVKWTNNGQKEEWITADNTSDPDFAKATPYFVSVSDLPSDYKVTKSVTVGSAETEVFYSAPDTLGQEKSFYTAPMKFAPNVLDSGKSVEYTFKHAGTFGYHSRAWERGYVTVLEEPNSK